jgi:transcriptional regulator with XRE-family HTH domain
MAAPDKTLKVDQGDIGDAIGRRLTSIRAEREMSVSQLARSVGVSASAISQIERGQARPSVATLFALSRALQVPADAFFSEIELGDGDARATHPQAPSWSGELASAAAGADRHPGWPPSEERHVLRHDRRPTLDCRGGVQWQRLTPMELPGLEFLELVYPAHAESDAELYRHPGFEFLVVTQGRLRISLAFEDHELGVGDSSTFPSSTPHRYVNPYDEEARAFSVLFLEDLTGMRPANTATAALSALAGQAWRTAST